MASTMTLVLRPAETPARVTRWDSLSWIYSPTVTIWVDKERKRYFAPQALIMAFSSYFEACLGPAFKEGQSLSVEMEDVSEHVFGAFVNWLYSARLTYLKTDTADRLIKLYILADRLLADHLKNDIVDFVRNEIKTKDRIVVPDLLTMMNQHGILHSNLGRFLMQKFVYEICVWPAMWYGRCATENDLAALEALYQDEATAVEVLKCVIRYNLERWQDPLDMESCVFHEHHNGLKCNSPADRC